MKKVISFSLWGNNPKYTIGAIKNAKLAHEIYPRWVSRFYIGRSTDPLIGKELEDLGAEVIYMPEDGNCTSMFWRFLPAGEENVEVMISRDTDSRLSLREKAAVIEWLSSEKQFHIMRDHPYHYALILGGMWGARGGILKNIKQMIEEYQKKDLYGDDQNFLTEKIYPLILNNSFVHDEFFSYNSFCRPFPTKRKSFEFVGDVFDMDDQRHPEYWKIMKKSLEKA